MTPLEIRIPHQLPPAEVARRAREAYRELARRHQRVRPHVTWTDDLHAIVDLQLLGMGVRAFFSIEPGELVVQARVPLALRAFAKRGRARVVEAASRWLTASASPESPA